MSYVYQWRRCDSTEAGDASGASCVDIGGETAATYLLAAADVAHKIGVTANDGTTTAYSSLTAVVGAAGSPSSDWATAIASYGTYATRNKGAQTRTRPFTTEAGLASLIGTMQAGDYIYYNGTGLLTIPHETTWSGHQPASTVVIDFGDPASPDHVHFTGYPNNLDGSASAWGLVCLYLPSNNKNLWLYGGEFENRGGSSGVFWTSGTNCRHWFYKIHHTGGANIDFVPASGLSLNNVSLFGEGYEWGQHPENDVHAEKGTGIHGIQCSDGGGSVTACDITFDGHDGPTGAALQYGSPSQTTNATIRLRAVNITKHSTSQRAGNGLNLWGGGPISGTVFYIEVDNAQGYAVSVDTEFGISFANVRFQSAQSTNTRQNPTWTSEPTFNPGPTYLTTPSPAT